MASDNSCETHDAWPFPCPDLSRHHRRASLPVQPGSRGQVVISIENPANSQPRDSIASYVGSNEIWIFTPRASPRRAETGVVQQRPIPPALRTADGKQTTRIETSFA